MISFSKFSVLFKKRRRSHSKVSNAERIVKIFRREAELQLSVQNNVGTLKQIILCMVPTVKLLILR